MAGLVENLLRQFDSEVEMLGLITRIGSEGDFFDPW